MTSLGKALHHLGCEISMLAMNTSKHKANVDRQPEELSYYSEIQTVEVDNQIRAIDAFKNLFTDDSYHISRFVSEEFQEKLIELLSRKTFDIIQLETLYLAPYLPIIRQYSKAMIAMRAHNVEHEIWERISAKSGFLPKKWYLRYLTNKLKRFEMDQLNEYDFLVAISERDLNQFKKLGYQNGAIASPVGIEAHHFSKLPQGRRQEKALSLFFIGSLDWMPNLDGLQWFMENVWAKTKSLPDSLTLHIAGRNTPDWMREKWTDRVRIHGEIADAHQYIRDHDVMIVPLFSGSGMRVKILEGMALGKMVITTSLGLEGIPAEHGKHVWVADTEEEFLDAIQQVIANKSIVAEIGENARQFVLENFDALEIAQRLLESYRYITSDSYSHT